MHNSLLLFLGDIGGSELILIMVVILVFFGANKIPELARGLGKGIREFKDASSEIRREFETSGQPAPPAQPAPYASPAQPYEPAALPPMVPGQPYMATPVVETTADPAPPVAATLPPNLAPEGTQPRQPYIPAEPGA